MVFSPGSSYFFRSVGNKTYSIAQSFAGGLINMERYRRRPLRDRRMTIGDEKVRLLSFECLYYACSTVLCSYKTPCTYKRGTIFVRARIERRLSYCLYLLEKSISFVFLW